MGLPHVRARAAGVFAAARDVTANAAEVKWSEPLLLVPAGFSLADGLEKRVGPWIGRRVLSYDPKEAAREQRAHASGEAFPAE